MDKTYIKAATCLRDEMGISLITFLDFQRQLTYLGVGSPYLREAEVGRGRFYYCPNKQTPRFVHTFVGEPRAALTRG